MVLPLFLMHNVMFSVWMTGVPAGCRTSKHKDSLDTVDYRPQFAHCFNQKSFTRWVKMYTSREVDTFISYFLNKEWFWGLQDELELSVWDPLGARIIVNP